ncbi:MAG: penicillin-binding protein 2 [bacterium]
MDIFGNFSKINTDRYRHNIKKKKELDFSFSETVHESLGKVESKTVLGSFFSIKMVLLAVFCILIWRVFSLQIVDGQYNRNLAEGNRIRPRIVEAMRGLIVDRNGSWLARNKPEFSLAVYPSDLPRKKADREVLYQKLVEISGVSIDDIRASVEKAGLSSLDMVIIKENVTHDESLLLEEKIVGLPGVFVAKQSMREYLQLSGLAHLIGYTGLITADDIKVAGNSYLMSDKIGKTGLEKMYENFLRGIHGVEEVEVNSKNTVTQVIVNDSNKDPVAGEDLTLYLDKGLQAKTAEALNNGIVSAKEFTGMDVSSGVAIVMDVNTGGILSYVSLPDYNNNLFATRISNADYQKLANDENKPMLNRGTSGLYPPGSVSKIILAAAGLSEGNITPFTAFNTPAAITIGSYVFPDWKDHSYESTNIVRAIAESNNVFFYSVGGGFDKIVGLGIDKIKKWWSLFGLGEKTGIDLPAEEAGLLPDVEWKQKVKNEPWYIGDTYHVSIGQGDLLVTPLQMLRATAVIANGGKLISPQLVKQITDSKNNIVKEFGPRIERENFIDPAVIQTIAEGMRLTITDGSARNLNDLPFSVAGKTGTAQFLNNEKTHAWFECYAPYEKPEIAIVVMIDGGGGGHEIAAPVAKDILSYYFANREAILGQ